MNYVHLPPFFLFLSVLEISLEYSSSYSSFLKLEDL